MIDRSLDRNLVLNKWLLMRLTYHCFQREMAPHRSVIMTRANHLCPPSICNRNNREEGCTNISKAIIFPIISQKALSLYGCAHLKLLPIAIVSGKVTTQVGGRILPNATIGRVEGARQVSDSRERERTASRPKGARPCPCWMAQVLSTTCCALGVVHEAVT